MLIEKNLSGHVIIIDPEIHKKAKLTRQQFLDRVSYVKQIRTAVNCTYVSFYITSLDEYLNLKRFYDLVNHGKFDFRSDYNFAIAVEPKLYEWFKNTEYTIIEKQIAFWLASFYFFVPSKRHILKEQLYKPLLEEIPKLINVFYEDFELPNWEQLYNGLLGENRQSDFVEEERCHREYLKQCQAFYNSAPPEFIASPFECDPLIDWGVNDRYGIEFVEAYFLEKDWDCIIVKNSKDGLGRVESRSDLWEKWKHTFATYDQKKTPVYSFYYPTKDKTHKKRESISQNVKDAVWRRDEGKCVECGSNEKLEFDHIIPVVKGGASTYRNIQLLCEPCNRAKYSKLG